MPTRCTATTAAGRPCRAWAVRDTDPPLCSAHVHANAGAGAPEGNQNRRTHGFYSAMLSQAERDDLDALGEELSLKDEIGCARVLLRRLTIYLGDNPDLDLEERRRIYDLALAAIRTIARLLRDQRAIGGEPADQWADILGGALDLLNEELGVEVQL
jgi:hypothetical protein